MSVLEFHLNNWSHRDIKPANILFVENNEKPWKLADLGESMKYENR